eukprot:1315722-Amorphochlora_amoeboformis.AAC.1
MVVVWIRIQVITVALERYTLAFLENFQRTRRDVHGRGRPAGLRLTAGIPQRMRLFVSEARRLIFFAFEGDSSTVCEASSSWSCRLGEALERATQRDCRAFAELALGSRWPLGVIVECTKPCGGPDFRISSPGRWRAFPPGRSFRSILSPSPNGLAKVSLMGSLGVLGWLVGAWMRVGRVRGVRGVRGEE